MEHKQKEQQEGLNQALVTHANWRLTIQKEKVNHAPAALATIAALILYIWLFHDFEQYNITVWYVCFFVVIAAAYALGCFFSKLARDAFPDRPSAGRRNSRPDDR